MIQINHPNLTMEIRVISELNEWNKTNQDEIGTDNEIMPKLDFKTIRQISLRSGYKQGCKRRKAIVGQAPDA